MAWQQSSLLLPSLRTAPEDHLVSFSLLLLLGKMVKCSQWTLSVPQVPKHLNWEYG